MANKNSQISYKNNNNVDKMLKGHVAKSPVREYRSVVYGSWMYTGEGVSRRVEHVALRCVVYLMNIRYWFV